MRERVVDCLLFPPSILVFSYGAKRIEASSNWQLLRSSYISQNKEQKDPSTPQQHTYKHISQPMTTTIANAEIEQLQAEVAPSESTILELMPHEMCCTVLEFSGGDEWMSALPMASRGLHDLCSRKEMRDAVRRWAMGVFKKGMDLFDGQSGAFVDRDPGKDLIRRAAKARLRSARAFCHYRWAWEKARGEEEEAEEEFAKAVALLEAEIAGSASETEASGGPCVHATSMLGHCYCDGLGVEQDVARALELYHHAVEVDKNQEAMLTLAYIYEYGHLGQARDYERALSLSKRGAELGDYDCRVRLGRIYRCGDCGVEVDLKQALYWYEKANEQRGGELTHLVEEIRDEMAMEFEMDETDETD